MVRNLTRTVAITLVFLALPLLQATTVSLGSAVNYGVLGLAGSENIYNSNVTIYGNEGISKGGTITNSYGDGSTLVTGSIYEYSQHQVSGYCTLAGCPGGNAGLVEGAPALVMSPALLNQNDADVATALSEIAALNTHPTQTMGSITDTNQTINGNGGMNVVDINGSITETGGQSLTLSGNSNDYFVVVVSGGMNLNGNGGLQLAGGVTANHVVYDFTGSNTGPNAVGSCGSNTVFGKTVNYQVCMNTGNQAYGTLIAPNLAYLLAGDITGEVIGGQEIYLTSGDPVIGDPLQSSDQGPTNPEPSSILLLGTGLSAFVGFLRQRRKRATVS